MDQTKIGKLIAKLRKEKGMTQRELGDKVGVGFKAVSKWERGITCPDISIINELSKILGITSDELLTGELKEEHTINQNNKRINKKVLLIVPILIFILIIIFIIYRINNNRTEIYTITSDINEYYIEGNVIFKNNNFNLNINKIIFKNKDISNIVITNYKYELYYRNNTIMKYGYIMNNDALLSPISIKEFTKIFNINYENKINIPKKDIIKNGLNLKIIFLAEDGNLIEKNIELTLNKN